MDLSGYEVWIIIGLVVGVIASNLAVLKHTAKFKMPHLGDHKGKSIKSADDENEQQETPKQDKSSSDEKS